MLPAESCWPCARGCSSWWQWQGRRRTGRSTASPEWCAPGGKGQQEHGELRVFFKQAGARLFPHIQQANQPSTTDHCRKHFQCRQASAVLQPSCSPRPPPHPTQPHPHHLPPLLPRRMLTSGSSTVAVLRCASIVSFSSAAASPSCTSSMAACRPGRVQAGAKGDGQSWERNKLASAPRDDGWAANSFMRHADAQRAWLPAHAQAASTTRPASKQRAAAARRTLSEWSTRRTSPSAST